MNITFTPSQAEHAQKVAMQLYKERRFFLPNGTSQLPHLSPNVFSELCKLDEAVATYYRETADQTELKILSEEKKHGIAKRAIIDEKARIVECKRYTGGLEIVAIMPLSALMVSLPTHECEISDVLLEARFPTTKRGSVTPDDLRMYRARLNEYAKNVFAEYRKLSQDTDYENKVVVVLDTRFAPGSYEDDFMLGKIEGLVTYPNFISYLLFKAGLEGVKFTTKSYTIFTSSRKGHIAIDNQDKPHSLMIGNRGGYDCLVSFATIL